MLACLIDTEEYLGEYAEKKSGKSVVFCQTRGGGVSEGKQKTKPQVWGLKKGQKWLKMTKNMTKNCLYGKKPNRGGS